MALFVKQLLAGCDFGKSDLFATQMANFVYLIGDDETRECMVVDPAWDVPGILNVVDRANLTLVGALATHYHPDHVGGEIFGHTISGVAELLSLRPVKIHVHRDEAEGVKLVTGLSESDVVRHEAGDRVPVGSNLVTLLHTPGHTPGSQCFLVDKSLVSGDTLFVGGCGRVDLPGGNPDQMYHSLTQVLGRLPDNTVLYPGHNYGSTPDSTIGEQKRQNLYLRISSLDDWRRVMSGAV
jgi:hydroxyacylglutathione hydrolase